MARNAFCTSRCRTQSHRVCDDYCGPCHREHLAREQGKPYHHPDRIKEEVEAAFDCYDIRRKEAEEFLKPEGRIEAVIDELKDMGYDVEESSEVYPGFGV